MCSLSTSSFSVLDPTTLEKFIQAATRAPFFTPAIFSLFLQLFNILTLPYPQIRTNQRDSPSLDLIQMSSPGDLKWPAPLCFAVFSTLICSHALVRITNIDRFASGKKILREVVVHTTPIILILQLIQMGSRGNRIQLQAFPYFAFVDIFKNYLKQFLMYLSAWLHYNPLEDIQ